MQVMLDTNLCIDVMRGNANAAAARLRSLGIGEAAISTITLAELQYGAWKSRRRAHHEGMIAAFCAPLIILPFGAMPAEVYGSIRAQLEAVGTPIGPLDTLIAAHALAEGLTLVTANTREFKRVGGLTVENWR